MKLEKECRLCTNYEIKKNGRATSDYFKCNQGYFDFKIQECTGIRQNGKKMTRRYNRGIKPFEGRLGKENIPCKGEKFSIYNNSGKYKELINQMFED
jgi:hypothetical protein